MIDFEAIRNYVVRKAHQFTERPLVPQQDPAERPEYPFVTYTFIAPYTPQASQPAETGQVVTDDEGKEWWEQARTEFPAMTLSLTAHAASAVAAVGAALSIRRFFEFDGRDDLYTFGLVVEEVTATADRTALLDGLHYEHRAGFDVLLRATSKITRQIDFIEALEINDEEHRVG